MRTRAREARWIAVQALAPPQDSPEADAAGEVFDLLVDSEVADLDWRGNHLSIGDVSRLAELCGLPITDLTGDPVGFREAGRHTSCRPRHRWVGPMRGRLGAFPGAEFQRGHPRGDGGQVGHLARRARSLARLAGRLRPRLGRRRVAPARARSGARRRAVRTSTACPGRSSSRPRRGALAESASGP